LLSVKVSDGVGWRGLPTQKLPYPRCMRGVETRKGARGSDLFISAAVATISFSGLREVNKLKEDHD
jgi:hypothetical protein